MHASVGVLKGYLGFSDLPLSSPPLAMPSRSRASSDPFTDPSRSPAKLPTPSLVRLPSETEFIGPDDVEAPLLPEADPLSDTPAAVALEEADLNQPRFRLWTFPAHIDDEETDALRSIISSSIARARLSKIRDVYFGPRPGQWHMIDDVRLPETSEGVVEAGTGRIWIGLEQREHWQGGVWYRFVRWWRRLFGQG
jgi:hypothetical protein